MSARLGSASPQSLLLLLVQCVSLFFLLIYVAAQQTNAEQQQQQQQQIARTSKVQPIDTAGIELHQSLRFEPAEVDFGQWPVGTAHSHTVTLYNQHVNRSVLLNSVTGRTPNFYSSFFENKILAPLSNTTFQVVFLPRDNGVVDTELLIHSSFGQARLTVRGEGRECPYRLQPLTGIKAPLNATLTPEITMYNPHNKPLQILEVYSSGGQFQLELPSGGQEGPQALWAIPPFTQKPVIRIRFHGRSAGNFSAYIRIKISHELTLPDQTSSVIEEVLVMPVEFEILSQTGLYAQNPVVDFGRLSTDNAHRAAAPKIKLQLVQSNEKRPHDFLGFNMRVLSGLLFDPNDNSITLDARKINETLVLDEIVLLRAAYKRNISALQEFTVRLRAHIFKGGLYYKDNSTTFLTHVHLNNSQKSNEAQLSRRQLIVRNDFEMPLAVFNVSVKPPLNLEIFELQLSKQLMNGVAILPPGSKLELLQVHLLNDSISYSSMLHVYTNISEYELPLAVCSGRLHVVGHNALQLSLDASYNATLHLGAVPDVDISHQGWITLINRNPTPIRFKDWHFLSPRGFSFQVALMGCVRQADKLWKEDKRFIPIETVDFRFCNQVAEGDVAVFEVALQEYMAENTDSVLNIWTPFEHIKVAVKFHSWKGKIELVQEKVNFPNCFPGKICSSDIYITSGLAIAIRLGSVEFNNEHLKFQHLNQTGGTLIEPRTITKIGSVYFEADKVCPTRCYIPPYDKASNKRIAFPGPRPNKSGGNLLFDELELRRRTELYRQLKWYFQTVVFTLTTRKVYQFQIPMPIFSEWPKLVRGGRQHLPMVEVGKTHIHNIKVHNPADVPLLVDYVISDARAPNAAHLSLPLEVMDLSASCLLTNKPVFSLATPMLREPILIPPNITLNVPIRFESQEVDSFCTLLHLRNNLTLYEPVWISAKTLQPQFRFGNRKPGNITPMMFEIKEAHLASCHEEFPPMPLVAVKRSFTARNAGELPIFIQSFHIGEYECEGYGFKVLDCQNFELKANESRKVDISFTPDFSLSRVQRPLILRTNLSVNEFHYELLATLPPVNVDICSKKLPRPAWEKSVRNAVMMLLASTFIFVILATHIDFTNIMYSQTLLYNVRQRGPIYPTFNLRNIMQRPFQARNVQTEENVMPPTSNGTAQQRNNLSNGVTTSNGMTHNNTSNHNQNNNSNSVKRRGRKTVTSSSSSVGIGTNMSLSDLGRALPRETTNSLESSLLQNIIIMSNNPHDNRVIVVGPKRRESTPTPPLTATNHESSTLSTSTCPLTPNLQQPTSSSTPLNNLTTATANIETSLETPVETDSSSQIAISKINLNNSLLKKREADKENDRESGISISSTTSNEMESSTVKKKQQQQQQHMSRARRSKLMAQDKKAEKERDREKLRERQMEREREREREKQKEKDQEKENHKEREREKERQEREKTKEREKRERERRLKEQQEKERIEKEQEKERERERQKELAKEKELERQKEQEREQQKEREKERQKEIAKQKEIDREKELKKQKEIEREKERERKKEREKQEQIEREKELKRQKEREREIERERERKKERERQKEREIEKEKERKREKEATKRKEAAQLTKTISDESKVLLSTMEPIFNGDEKVQELKATGKENEKPNSKDIVLRFKKDKEQLKVEQQALENNQEKMRYEEKKNVTRENNKDNETNNNTDKSPQFSTPKDNGNAKEITRKYGKTPGRERRKETGQSNNVSTVAERIQASSSGFLTSNDVEDALKQCSTQMEKFDRKLKNRAVQALVFDAAEPATTSVVNGHSSGSENASPNGIRSPWENVSHAALGDLIQSRQNIKETQETMHQTKDKMETHMAAEKILEKNTNELGPIGSRKSPSSTPLWESVQKQQQQQAEQVQFPKPIITNNSSFFSNLPGSGSPNLNSFGLGEGQFMGIPTNLYELQKVQMELQRQLQTNEFIINLHQQQQRLQQQQELLQGAGDIAAAATATMTSNNQWANNNGAAWSPMGYRQAVGLNIGSGNSSSSNTNHESRSNMVGLRLNANNTAQCPTANRGGALPPWQQLGLTRPPPGLNASPNHIQQQPTQQHQLQQPVFPQHRQQQQQQQPNGPQQQPDIQQFDPFKSLSSIWSDNWNRNNRNGN